MAGLPEEYAAFTMPAAGGQNQVDVRVLHQRIGQLHARLVDPADDVLRRTGSHGSFQYQPGGFASGAACTRVRREDDGIAGFQRNQRLENGGGSGVGGGHDAAQDANGLGNGDGAEAVVFRQHAAGFFILVLVVDVLGGKVILDHLVFHHPHAGFFHRHARQRNARIGCGQRRAAENDIHLLLGEFGKNRLGLFDTRYQRIQLFQ
jgi:hypothetical protein